MVCAFDLSMTDKIVMDHTPPATTVEANVLHIQSETDKPKPEPQDKPQEAQPAMTVTTTVPVTPQETPKEKE